MPPQTENGSSESVTGSRQLENGQHQAERRLERDPDSEPSSTPVAAFLLAFGSALCIISTAVVIYSSHDRAVGDWVPSTPSVQPSVLLSILASTFRTFQNLLLTYGVTILWWRTAREGTKLKNLHYIWNKGEWNSFNGVSRAWSSSKRTKYLMLVVCLISVANFVTGPLLQRATKSVFLNLVTEYSVQWALPGNIPVGWTGSVDHNAPASLFANGFFDEMLQDWYLDRPMKVTTFCNGTCMGEVQGVGIATSCSRETRYQDLPSLGSGNATMFDLMFNRTQGENREPILNMRYLYAAAVDGECNATIQIQTCAIRMATVRYMVIQQEDIVNIDTDYQPLVLSTEISDGDSVDAQDDLPAGPLAGLDYFGYYYLRSNGSIYRNNTDGTYWVEPGHGSLVIQYADYRRSHYGSCAFQWQDATEEILWDLHKVVFRMGLAVSNGNRLTHREGSQPANATSWRNVSPTLMYQSDFGIFWAAFTFMLLAFFCSSSLLWGFTALKRQVTLSPLETSRVLQEFALDIETANEPDMEVEKLIKNKGDRDVKWVRNP
ncbi:hypothetical protein B0O99DRAFT_516291 [Bisporella sp. PMI_857]|nr:hypothetical protein B0O99DRAFT_516291 [Bisporella sp. PMI_857]